MGRCACRFPAHRPPLTFCELSSSKGNCACDGRVCDLSTISILPGWLRDLVHFCLRGVGRVRVVTGMEISVLTFTGRRFPLFVDPLDTISTVKAKIHDKEGIPVHQQRLSISGHIARNWRPMGVWRAGLQDDLTLSHCQVQPHTSLLLWRDGRADEPVASAVLESASPPQRCLFRVVAPSDLLYTHVPGQTFRDGQPV